MKINQSTLLNALLTVNKAVSTSNIVPITKCILLSSKDGKLTMSATNFNIYIETLVSNQDCETIHAAVDAELFTSFIKNLPAQQIEFSIEDDVLTILHHTGSASFDIFTDEFPVMPMPKTKNTLVIKSDVIKNGMALTSYGAANKDCPIASLTNCLWRFTENRVTFFGFSPNMGATYFYDIESAVIGDILIPPHAFSVFDNLADESLAVVFDKTNLLISSEKTKVSIRLADENYPDAAGAIPTVGDLTAKVDRSELLSALSRVRSFQEIDTRLNNRYIKLAFSADAIDVTAEYINAKRKANEKVSCEYIGEPLEMMFNIDYLSAILKKFTTEHIVLNLKDYRTAAIITTNGQEGKDDLCLLMPYAKY